MKKERPPFACSLNKTERILGAFLLPVHILALPLLLGMLGDFWPTEISAAKLNTLYYLITFLLILLLMRKGLRRDWDRLCDYKLPCALLLVPTHLLCLVLSLVVALITVLMPESISELYNEAPPELITISGKGLFAAYVLLAPIVDETLFRGLVFGSLREKNRVLAYAVSIALYLVYCVWQYAVLNPNISILFYALQEIPAAFVLAWCYERSGTVWTPILYHAIYNFVPVIMSATAS